MAKNKKKTEQSKETSDSQILIELLEYLDILNGVLSAIQETIEAGADRVKLGKKGKGVKVEKALDNATLDLTRKTIQVRAIRALRDGVIDSTLSDVLEDAVSDDAARESQAHLYRKE